MFPKTLTAITLGKWIDYTNSLAGLEAKLSEVKDMPEGQRKQILLTRNLVDTAYHTYAFFGGKDSPPVEDVLKGYTEGFCKLFDNVEPSDTDLPSHELAGNHPMTFGQLIDAKMIAQGAANENSNKWALLQYIAAIFMSDGDYKADYVSEDNEVYKSMAELPMNVVVALSQWWEKLNEYINSNYTLFQDSGEPEKANVKEHMHRWGWVNFLKSIAKTKVFDIAGSGLNSIDSARQALATDVLTWASEEKDYNIAVGRDMEN